MFSSSQPTQSLSRHSQPSANNDISMDAERQGQTPVQTLYLKPEAYPRGGKEKWKATGRTISAAAGPVGGELAVWVTKRVRSLAPFTEQCRPNSLRRSHHLCVYQLFTTASNPTIYRVTSVVHLTSTNRRRFRSTAAVVCRVRCQWRCRVMGYKRELWSGGIVGSA